MILEMQQKLLVVRGKRCFLNIAVVFFTSQKPKNEIPTYCAWIFAPSGGLEPEEALELNHCVMVVGEVTYHQPPDTS